MNAIEEIEKLAKLRDRGVLTEEEFQELKAYTLSSEVRCRMDALRLSILLTT
jgi:uncharacterized protein YnzC (UPF0291/DUF896 family)